MKSNANGPLSVTGRKPFNRTQISQRFRRLSTQPLAEDLDPDLQKVFSHHPEECNCFLCDQYNEYHHVQRVDFIKQAVRNAIHGTGNQSMADFFPPQLRDKWLASNGRTGTPTPTKDKHQLSQGIFEFKEFIDQQQTTSAKGNQ